jgi:hypothetical protein|tara:strand:+ start:141 stop:338 length:198 start_codon:yes stop_codon:yes gene_type:complete
VFTYDDGLLADMLWQELAKAKRENILLSCQLHVAESVVAELQEQIKLFVDQTGASESETDDVKGD